MNSSGVRVTAGSLTQSAGTLTENGIYVDSGATTFTTGGTLNSANINMGAIAVGTYRGLNISTNGTARTITAGASITGINLDLNNNVTATGVTMTGAALQTAADTNIANATKKVLTVTSGAITENTAANTGLFVGADITVPALTLTTGTALNAYGARITTGNLTQSAGALSENGLIVDSGATTFTTGGTLNGVNVNVGAVSVGTFNGVNISTNGTARSITGGTVTGFNLDLNNNVTATGVALTGEAIQTAADTNIASVTKAGLTIASGAITENTTSATGVYNGASITLPALVLTTGTSLTASGVNITTGNITQSAGTLTQNGVNISTANSTITIGGTINAINITPPATATSTGAQNAINIGAITTVGSGMTGIKVGNNWNTSVSMAWPSATTAITNTSLDFGAASTTQTLSGVIKLARSNTTAVCATATAQGIVFKNDAGTQVGHFCTDSANLSLWVASSNTSSADLAENYSDVNNNLEPGDVVALLANGPVKGISKASKRNKYMVGIISTNPGVTLTDISESDGKTDLVHPKPVALIGRVPTKISDENGPIHVGDYVTASATKPGYAMKATKPGLVPLQHRLTPRPLQIDFTAKPYFVKVYLRPKVECKSKGNKDV